MEGILPYIGRKELALLQPRLQLARAHDGQYIIRAGNPSPALFIIRSGEVDLLHNRNGYDVHIATLKKDNLFGESAFLGTDPSSTSARARTETDLIVLNPHKLNPLFENSPLLFSQFHRSLALLISRKLRIATEGTAACLAPSDPFANLPTWEIL